MVFGTDIVTVGWLIDWLRFEAYSLNSAYVMYSSLLKSHSENGAEEQ